MKIRKVTDSQIMLLVTSKELDERNMNISDIASNTIKAQKLFKEVISTVVMEYGFADDEDPIMVEAAPSSEGITIVISKIRESGDEISTLMPEAYEGRKFVNSPKIFKQSGEVSAELATMTIYEFENFSDTERACVRVSQKYNGESEFYKCDHKYYLVMHSDGSAIADEIENILLEYGKRVETQSEKLFVYYIKEHGESVIKKNAVGILASLAV